MNATRQHRERGQSIWLDNITRSMLDNGQIQRYIDIHSVTGLTSHPSIYDNAIDTGDYGPAISERHHEGLSAQEIFFDLAIEDLQRAADLFAPVHERTAGVDGWVSPEVSPLLAYDSAKTVEAALALHARVNRAHLFVQIPGTPQGLLAIEECIVAKVPVNVTLLFDASQYIATAEAYLQAIERRIDVGLNPSVAIVASVFISRWDTAVGDVVPDVLKNQLGLTVGRGVYSAYRGVVESHRFQALQNFGARTQRLLWASNKTKDPSASDTMYVSGLVAPFTINTMPDSTLNTFFDHGALGDVLSRDGSDNGVKMERFSDAGIDAWALAGRLQSDGKTGFTKYWTSLLAKIDAQIITARRRL